MRVFSKDKYCFVFIFFTSLILFLAACNNEPKQGKISQEKKPPPPPITLNIDVEKTCADLGKVEADSMYNGVVYLISDSINMEDRVLFEYLLHKEYNLLFRGIISELDTVCLRPFYDTIIEDKFHKSRKEILLEIGEKISVLRNQIGQGQVKKGVYYSADTYPKYPGGLTNLYFSINSLKDSLGKGVDDTGSVMFYFTINTAGIVSDVEIYQHLNNSADSITTVIMKSLPEKWLPAIVSGRKVSFWMQYAIEW